VSALKVCLALVALFCGGFSGVLLGLAVPLLVVLAVVTWRSKPCPEVRAATTLRFAFQASAVLTVLCACVALALADPTNDAPIVLFFFGNACLFAGLAVAFRRLPWLLDNPANNKSAAALALANAAKVAKTGGLAAEKAAKHAIDFSDKLEEGLLGHAAGWITGVVESFQRTVNLDDGLESTAASVVGKAAKTALMMAIRESKAEAAGKAREFLQEELTEAVLSMLGF
jgi:hypothetical protein